MPRGWLLRPLLRWTSLVAVLVLLVVLGGRRTHLHDFVSFLVILVAVAVAVVAVFVVTAEKEPPGEI